MVVKIEMLHDVTNSTVKTSVLVERWGRLWAGFGIFWSYLCCTCPVCTCRKHRRRIASEKTVSAPVDYGEKQPDTITLTVRVNP